MLIANGYNEPSNPHCEKWVKSKEETFTNIEFAYDLYTNVLHTKQRRMRRRDRRE